MKFSLSLLCACILPVVSFYSNAQSLKTTSFNWSGMDWTIKKASHANPGPNDWSENNVYIDKSGFLHLKVVPTEQGCSSSEIISTKKYGAGAYSVVLKTAPVEWPSNLVFGFFNYPQKYGLLNYTVWPTDPALTRITHNSILPLFKEATFSFVRAVSEEGQAKVNYASNVNNVVYTWSLQGNDKVSSADMPLILNLWCYKGSNKDLKLPFEIVIKSVHYTPLN